MDNKEFSEGLEKRSKEFATEIIKLSSSFSDTPELKVIRYQLIKSGTSIGANYREANRSRSKADFLNKIKICESEASETVYWLEILTDISEESIGRIEIAMKEAKELLAIFTSISKKLKLKT